MKKKSNHIVKLYCSIFLGLMHEDEEEEDER